MRSYLKYSWHFCVWLVHFETQKFFKNPESSLQCASWTEVKANLAFKCQIDKNQKKRTECFLKTSSHFFDWDLITLRVIFSKEARMMLWITVLGLTYIKNFRLFFSGRASHLNFTWTYSSFNQFLEINQHLLCLNWHYNVYIQTCTCCG